jgi:hypothetical protein
MAIVINEFETLAEPPRPDETTKQGNDSKDGSKSALTAAAEFAEAVRRLVNVTDACGRIDTNRLLSTQSKYG